MHNKLPGPALRRDRSIRTNSRWFLSLNMLLYSEKYFEIKKNKQQQKMNVNLNLTNFFSSLFYPFIFEVLHQLRGIMEDVSR